MSISYYLLQVTCVVLSTVRNVNFVYWKMLIQLYVFRRKSYIVTGEAKTDKFEIYFLLENFQENMYSYCFTRTVQNVIDRVCQKIIGVTDRAATQDSDFL